MSTKQKKNKKTKINAKILFENNKKQTISLDKKLTIEDLVKLGVTEIRLAKIDGQLDDNWWQSLPHSYSRYE